MSGIQHVLLRDLLMDSQNGLSKRGGDDGQPTPVLRLADISNGAINEDSPREIFLTSNEVEKYTLVAGDLVCIRVNGSKGLVGRVIPFRSLRKWAYCDHFIRLRPRQDVVDSLYLAHYCQTSAVRRHIELNMVSSAGQNTVSQGTMLNVAVPLPSLAEQRLTIAEIEKQFARVDDAVANLQRVKANMRRYRASALKDAVGSRKDGSPWQRTTLGQVASSIRNGYSQKPDSESGTRILRISAVRPLELDGGDIRFLSGGPAEYDPYLVTAGDVLFTRYNGSREYVGVCAMVPSGLQPTVYPDKLIRVRVMSDTILPAFLVIAASTGEARDFIESRIRTTAGQSGISGADLKGIPLRFPAVETQRRIIAEFDRRLSIVRELEAEVDANLKRAETLRQAILSKAFGG